MFGDLVSGALILIGLLLLVMGMTGSYAVLDQFGISLPGAAETTSPEQTKIGMAASAPGSSSGASSSGGATQTIITPGGPGGIIGV